MPPTTVSVFESAETALQALKSHTEPLLTESRRKALYAGAGIAMATAGAFLGIDGLVSALSGHAKKSLIQSALGLTLLGGSVYAAKRSWRPIEVKAFAEALDKWLASHGVSPKPNPARESSLSKPTHETPATPSSISKSEQQQRQDSGNESLQRFIDTPTPLHRS